MSDAFDFYPCLVDGAPASIYLNLRFEHERPAGADTRYSVAIRMADAGPHGAGTAEEADALNAFEEKTIERLATRGLVYVGRLRSEGTWEITFYGPPDREEHVREGAREMTDRTIDVTWVRDAS